MPNNHTLTGLVLSDYAVNSSHSSQWVKNQSDYYVAVFYGSSHTEAVTRALDWIRQVSPTSLAAQVTAEEVVHATP